MKYSIGLVTLGSYLHAWVLDLPGCLVGGRTMDEIAQMLPIVIAEHLAWLASHGGAIGGNDGWEITERLDSTARSDFCFDAERKPLSLEEMDRLVTRMAFARRDLLNSLNGLPDAVLDWEPPADAFASFDAWAPEVRSIRAVATHVLQLEAFYRGALHDGPVRGIFERVNDPESERARTIDALRSLSDAGRQRVYRPLHPSQHEAGEWTVRKAVRRIISHDRAHTAEIQQRRTWLLLGVPTVSPK